MAFRLRHDDKSVARGIRRLAQKQLRSALDELKKWDGSQDEAVHEARTRVKKVRALLRVVEADHGRHLSGSKKRLRSVNRRLSTLRDADATLEMFEKIRDANPRLMSEHSFARLRRMLSRHKHLTVRKARRDHSRKEAAKAIRAVQKSVKRWQSRHDGFGLLAAGIRSAHRRGRKAMQRALKSQRAIDFHAWRKEIKTLRYELRLLEACGAAIRKDIRMLDRAETMLGDDHNSVVMGEYLFGDTTSRPDADLDKLRYAVERYQRKLRRQTIAITRRTYTVSSGEYLGRVRAAWKRWHRPSTSDARRRSPRAAA